MVELARPTDDNQKILQAVSQAFDVIYRPHYRFMKAGVMLIDLIDANRQQMSLLDTAQSKAQRERSERLVATLDALNQRMGRGTVKFGVPTHYTAWHLRCANRSPRWTTRWSELVNVKARQEQESPVKIRKPNLHRSGLYLPVHEYLSWPPFHASLGASIMN